MRFLKLQLRIEKNSFLMYKIQRKRTIPQKNQSAISQKHLNLGLFSLLILKQRGVILLEKLISKHFEDPSVGDIPP